MRHQRLGLIGLSVVAAVTLVVVLWPSPVDGGLRGSISELLGWLHSVGLPDWFGYAQLEFGANVIMFVPVGMFLLLLISAKRFWLGVAIVPALSLAIEGAQLVFLPGRFATLLDVFANSVGGWIGVAAAALVLAARQSGSRVDQQPKLPQRQPQEHRFEQLPQQTAGSR